MMFVFLIVILLIAALLEYISLRGGAACVDADLTLSAPESEPGAPVTLTATVRNLGRLPVSYLSLRTGFPLCASFPEGVRVQRDRYFCTHTGVYRLWGRQTVQRGMEFSVAKRGVHTVSGRELARGDFLGLRTQSERLSLHRTLLVYPKRLESGALTEALGSYCGELSAQRWLLRDPVLTLGVREYSGSEPMHTISWSQTARQGELTVREFDFTRSLNCCILLCVSSLRDGEDELLDRCCGAARTVCDALIAAGVEATLYTNAALTGLRSEPIRSATASLGRQKDVLSILARVSEIPCSSATELARGALEAQTDAAAFVLIAPHQTPGIDAALNMLNAQGGMGALLVAADGLEAD